MNVRRANLDDIRPMRRTGAATLMRWVPCCRRRREVELPEHPAGIGHCRTCGNYVDLADYPQAECREYLAQYTPEEPER